MLLKKLLEIFSSECNYDTINKEGSIKMRNCENGIQLCDAFLYRFLYSKKGMTKERAVSIINFKNGTSFTRQSFESKENNIPFKIYENIFHKLRSNFNVDQDEDFYNLIGIDGTYNNDINMNEVLNMGFYDITNGIPIDIKSYGKQNKNREIHSAMDFIKNNLDLFKNNIIVADRAYFSYDFLDFLIANDLKYIIRVKGKGKHFRFPNSLKPSTKKYNKILKIKNNSRIIILNNVIQKRIYAAKGKKSNTEKYTIDIKNDCVIITNLLDDRTYTDKKILDMYRSRWDIEVFFKYVKSNYNFRHLKEKSQISINKTYICELIITYISKIIERHNTEKKLIKKKEFTYKVNKNNLINGIFDSILYNILRNNLTRKKLKRFCKAYFKIIQNRTNRSHPRNAKTPFTKWYVKGYSEQTKYKKIVDAIINGKVNELNKNLKVIAKNIISINGKKYE